MGTLHYENKRLNKHLSWSSEKLSDEQLQSDSFIKGCLEKLAFVDTANEEYIAKAENTFNDFVRDIVTRINMLEENYEYLIPHNKAEYSNRLFVDMDGTIARFHDEVNYLEQMFEKGFFLNLAPFTKMIDGLKLYMTQHPETDVYILSATIDGEPPHCKREKEAWIERYLPEIKPENRLFVPMGADKSLYIPNGIRKSDTLLDDYNVNLDAWQKAGGNPIKCKNNINHLGLKGPLWVGKLIDNNMFPDAISQHLEHCIDNDLSRNDEDIER